MLGNRLLNCSLQRHASILPLQFHESRLREMRDEGLLAF
jgi:hypothetical protein